MVQLSLNAAIGSNNMSTIQEVHDYLAWQIGLDKGKGQCPITIADLCWPCSLRKLQKNTMMVCEAVEEGLTAILKENKGDK